MINRIAMANNAAVRGRRAGAGLDGAVENYLNPALQAWGEDIEKSSGCTIRFMLFPSEQLGKAMDHYDWRATSLM